MKETRTCKYCDESFIAKRDWKVFCSRPCREMYHKRVWELARELAHKMEPKMTEEERAERERKQKEEKNDRI